MYCFKTLFIVEIMSSPLTAHVVVRPVWGGGGSFLNTLWLCSRVDVGIDFASPREKKKFSENKIKNKKGPTVYRRSSVH